MNSGIAHTAEHTHAAERASRHARTAARLRVGRLLHLGGKLRHKAQRDTHNDAELVRRKSHTRKRREQALKARGEVERRCGERDSAHTGHHQGQAARHKGSGTQRPSLICKKPSCHRMRPLWSENRLSTATTATIASSGAIDDRTRRAGNRDTV